MFPLHINATQLLRSCMSMPSFMYHLCMASCKVTVTFLDGFVHM